MQRGFPTLVKRYVRTGRIALELRGVGIIRPGSRPALLYALAAGRQDRLWNLAHRFYAQQDALELVATDVGVRRLARGIPGLDVARLLRDTRSPAIARQADATLAQARRLGIPGTPSFGVRVDGGKVRPAVPTGLGAAAMTQLVEAALDLAGPKA
jgi:protein-disulfide isomerase